MKSTKIRCILTGGTIDNQYHQRLGKMVIQKNVEKMLTKLRMPHHEFICERLFKLDSRELKTEHREKILASIRQATETGIIITHGTDTLVASARFVAEGLKLNTTKNKNVQQKTNKLQKTVVFTGAMEPYGIEHSQPTGMKNDALQNLISAISLVGVLPAGVWIVFHGLVLRPEKAFKDYKTLTFLEH